MTIKNLYPKSRPATIYNVINGRPELPAQGVYEQASETYYFNKAFEFKKAAPNEPRFQYDPNTREFDGLLLEGEVTNYCKNSSVMRSNFSTTTETAAPDGEMNALKKGTSQSYCNSIDGNPPVAKWGMCSAFVKKGTANIIGFQPGGTGPVNGPSINRQFVLAIVDLRDGTFLKTGQWPGRSGNYATCSKVNDDWWFITYEWENGGTYNNAAFTMTAYEDSVASVLPTADYKEIIPYESLSLNFYMCYTMITGGADSFTGGKAQMYVPTTTDKVTKPADKFSLTSKNNFDNGFSLLLDSITTTKDFVYKIKAGSTVAAQLKNDAGTLDWEIGDPPKSAKINGTYPQVGFVGGRVRTVSSFGTAGIGDVSNYLYTTGISFPTKAEPVRGVDSIEFGTPQTMKALYLWNGQLASAEAISVIKGQPDSDVNKVPVVGDPYSFVYNTDPTNVGETSITLPYIVPNKSMRIYWGDGTSDRIEKAADNTIPLPQHTYPYPGQYRIEIVSGDDLFDSVRLCDLPDTIMRVDQWAPQHRVGASGPGFTDSDMDNILTSQSTMKYVADFKYTDIKTLYQSWSNCGSLNDIDTWWSWIPVNLPAATQLISSFQNLTRYDDGGKAKRLPQLQTSSNLLSVRACFSGCFNTNFFDPSKSPTFLPWTNTSKVTDFSYSLYKYQGTEVAIMDMSSAREIAGMFYDNVNLTFVQPYSLPVCTNIQEAWRNCKTLTSFPSLQFPEVTNITRAWRNCTGLTEFPKLEFPKCESFNSAWQDCTGLTTFPKIDTSKVTNFAAAWYGNSNLETFPEIVIRNDGTEIDLGATWQGCVTLKRFPELDTESVTSMNSTWLYDSGLEDPFPKLKTQNCRAFSYTWRGCTGLTGFPDIDTGKGEVFFQCWYGCSNIVGFPTFDYQNATDIRSAFNAVQKFTDFTFKGSGFPKLEQADGAWVNCLQMSSFPANAFDTTGTLTNTAFLDAFEGCALAPSSIENILTSLVVNGAANIQLGIQGGSNAPRYAGSSGTGSDSTSWTPTTEAKFQALLAAGWTITYNKYAGVEDTLPAVFRVLHGPDAVHFVETSATVESGQPNQETFADEAGAVARVLELDENFFPAWDRERLYITGERVKFGQRVYRALEEIDAREFELPNLELEPELEVATPLNRTARWAEVYDPRAEDLPGLSE